MDVVCYESPLDASAALASTFHQAIEQQLYCMQGLQKVLENGCQNSIDEILHGLEHPS